MTNFISKILFLFSRREKLLALFLLLLMLFGAIFEATGVALVFPLIALISNPAVIGENQALSRLYEFFNSPSAKSFSVLMVGILLAIYLLKYLYLFVLYSLQYRFVFNRQTSLSVRIFKAYLQSPYPFHLQRNSAKLLANVNTTVYLIFNGVIVPAFIVLVEILVVVSILLVLVFMAPLPTVGAVIILGGSSVLFYYFVRRRSAAFGKIQEERYVQMMKWVNQGLGGIKEVKILGRENFFLQAFAANSVGYGQATRFIRTLSDVSRLFIEGLVICSVLATVGVMLYLDQDVQSLVPTLGLFAIAAIRLMPSANRMLYSLTTIRYHTVFVDEIYQDLKELDEIYATDSPVKTTDESAGKVSFNNAIELENVSFHYAGHDKNVLKNISFSIAKGQSVAFVGSSGAGKTTVVDVILGLLEPTGGRVLVDKTDIKISLADWQRKIGYIPQPIYLSDDSIMRNVAFGVDDENIDENQVWNSLRAAQMDEFVKTLPEKLATNVGENGVSLSGGQRQRIGIARALYHNPEVLVLDEATAALDNKTEREVTKAIEALSKNNTIIAIAHRLTTVKNFDCIFFMKDGEIIDSGNFDYLLENNREFQIMANYSLLENK